MTDRPRSFTARTAKRGEEPLLIGLVGPPGGGKTFSALRLAKGIQSMRGGDIVLIDTEGGRARKYSDSLKFLHVNFEPPHRPNHFADAIQQFASQTPTPAAIIVDSMSDEHEGVGGYLEWHDEMVPKMGGNEWAAWSVPSTARKRMITSLLHIKVPLIFTFRAREKTAQQTKQGSSRKEIVNLGWMPVAPLEIVHALDLVGLLPPRAGGRPVWESEKVGEDFIVKLPEFLKPFIHQGELDEKTGAALAAWANGKGPGPSTPDAPAASNVPPREVAGADLTDVLMDWDRRLEEASKKGVDVLKAKWAEVPRDLQPSLKAALDNRHKPAAETADAKEKHDARLSQ